MEKPKKLLLILLLPLFVFPKLSYSQWEMASGLDGANLVSMVSIDSVLIAISEDRGIYTKTNEESWEISNFNSSFRKLTKAGKCVFAYNSMFDNAIRSFDYGVTWESAETLYSTSQVWSIDTVIFYRGTKRSFNYGTTYDTIQFPIPDSSPQVFCDDSLLFAYYQGDPSEDIPSIFYSSDLGETWDSISIQGFYRGIYYTHTIYQIMYMNGTFWLQDDGEYSGGPSPRDIFVFDGDLNSWINVTNNLPRFSWHHDLFSYNGNILCSIDKYPVFKFNYADSSWSQFAEASKNVYQFLLHGEELFCTAKQGACSLDTLGNWTTYYDGLHHREVSSICSHDGIIYVTANDELFYSEDEGLSFQLRPGGYGFQIITTDTVFYVASDHEFRISRDYGTTWVSNSDSIDFHHGSFIQHISISPAAYFVGTYRGLYRSLSDSIAWEKVVNGPFFYDFSARDVEAIDTTVLVGEYDWLPGRLYFSNDNGISFSDYDEYSILRKVGQSYYLLKDSIYRSDDLAQSWKLIPVDMDGYRGRCIDEKGDTIITGGEIDFEPSIVMTYNNGDDWIDLIDDLPILSEDYFGPYIETLKIVDGRIFVANPKYGLWYRDDILTSLNDKPSSFDNKIKNIVTSPNPFKTSTTMSYNLQQPSPVQITIYNHLGNQVEIIQQKQSSGKQQIVWNAEQFPSGMYYFTLQAGGQMASGKMVVVK